MIVFNVEGRRPARHSSERTDGVLASRVTPGSRSAIASALGMTRTVPPTVSGPSTSRTNGSKLNEMEVVVTANSSGEKVACTHSNTLVRLSWTTSTAFGRPDDPEVKRMYAAASGAGSTRRLPSVAPARARSPIVEGSTTVNDAPRRCEPPGASDDHRDADAAHTWSAAWRRGTRGRGARTLHVPPRPRAWRQRPPSNGAGTPRPAPPARCRTPVSPW